MLNGADIDGLDKFLASSGRNDLQCVKERDGILSIGTMLGNWRIEAFLGRGGNGEVYRVVHVVMRTAAAAKILIRDTTVSQKRFQDEIDFLSQNQYPQFPRYYESGKHNGRPYFILELLEPIDIPIDEKGIAEYLIDVCTSVRALHISGIVHRDLKPKNIMRRTTGEVVLIDFGLAKDAFEFPRPRTGISIESGKVVGVGTPDYAAPEQFIGGDVSCVADIHALGRIANAAFGGNPPRAWEAIIRRATSSIPAQRYATVGDFATAIRNRNRNRRCLIGVLAVASLLAVTALCFRIFGYERYVWYQLGGKGQTDLVTKIELGRKKHVFTKPLKLMANHEYWIVGPGTLDASILSAGSNTTLRLRDCVVLNRSKIPFKMSGIRYAFQGNSYLNFTVQTKPYGFSAEEFEGFDFSNEIRFKGPETLEALSDLKQKANFEYFKK